MFKEMIQNKIMLAPMAGITDRAFREVCKENGADIVFTEMVSAKALCYQDKKTQSLLEVGDLEKPYGIQIFGSEPEVIYEAVEKLNGRDHILLDLNLGCPAPKVVKNGDGSALMKDPKRTAKVIEAAVKASRKPVSVKIRKGWDQHRINDLEIAQIAEASGAEMLTIHGRTREEFYSGKADWKAIRRVKEGIRIPVIGNGDVVTGEDAKNLLEETGADGIMIGRGAQGNPFVFRQIKSFLNNQPISPVPATELKAVVLRHLGKATAYKGERTAVKEMRKHLGWYVKGRPHATALKREINYAVTKEELTMLIEKHFV